MMRIALPIVAAAAILCVDVPSGQAQIVGNAPWCAVMEIGAGEVEKDCEYFSVQECAPNVIAGNRGVCQMNPYYRAAPPRAPRRLHHRRHQRPHR